MYDDKDDECMMINDNESMIMKTMQSRGQGVQIGKAPFTVTLIF